MLSTKEELYMKIFLNSNIINNLNLSKYDIATYVAIRSIYHSNQKEFYISTDMLAYTLFGCNIPTRALGQIKKSITNLAQLGLFEIIKTLNQSAGSYVIKDKLLNVDTTRAIITGEYFTVISFDEMRMIMTLPCKNNKFALLRFFINVVGTFDRGYGIYEDMDAKTNFVGYMTQEYIGKLSGINVGVVEDYFQILEDVYLLYVYRHTGVRCVNGQFQSLANHYGRYKDKEDIIQFALAYEKSIGVKSAKQNSNANHKRAIMAKYKYILSDPNKYLQKYSEQELIAIYQYISKRNQQQKDIEKSDIKDLTVLEQVPCIIEYMKKCAEYDNSDWGDYNELTNSDEEVDLETV